MSKLTQLLHQSAMVALIVTAIAVLGVGYCFVWPFDVMQVKAIVILSPQVEVGELLEYRLDYCLNREYAFRRTVIEYSFKDGLTHNMTPVTGSLPGGCSSAFETLVVPPVPEGPYRLEMIRNYSVNKLRTIEVRAVSDVFKVSGKRRLKEMLKQQLPDVIHEVAPGIPVR